ncbi:MAG: phosphate ABC transporter ATP-binding protein [Bdellovibrionota bacterium]
MTLAHEPHHDPAMLIPHIDVRNLQLYYRDHAALADVSMPIAKGKITSLVGPSGCGKTSFLMALNRLTDLVEGCRVEGLVVFDGKSTVESSLRVAQLRRRIGMIFQKPNPFPLSVRRNLEFPLREHGITDRKTLDEVVESTLVRVGLWDEVKDRLDKPALRLSGGQQQRLCIARAVCLEPEVLLMDEPCSALDPISSEKIEELIRALRGRYTIVIVTHNLAQARRISDFTALFWTVAGCGRMIEFGPTQQIFE